MKRMIVKTALFSLLTAALIALPSVSRAQDQTASTNAPAATATPAKKLPFHGKAAAVDTAAMTLTVGTLVINVTSETKITKNGKPATLDDIKVDDVVSGSYKKDDDGKLNASMIRDGIKKKKKAATTDTSTNAPAAAPAQN
jgi:hypothetical protein